MYIAPSTGMICLNMNMTILVGNYQGEISCDPEEIEETKWITFSDLAADLVEYPEKYASWFLIAAPGFLERYADSENTDL